jgi:hypothetical protein
MTYTWLWILDTISKKLPSKNVKPAKRAWLAALWLQASMLRFFSFGKAACPKHPRHYEAKIPIVTVVA